MSAYKRIQLIALSALGLILPLIAFEISVRLGAFESTGPSDDRPNRYYFPSNAASPRDYPHDYDKPPQTFRIITVGDSFAFGDRLQFDDTFSKRIERWLNLRGGELKAEAINLSKPGFSTFDEVRLVREAVTRMNPDLVILQFTLNDPELRPYRDTHRAKLAPSRLEQPPFSHWHSLQLILKRLKNRRSRAEFKEYYQDLFNDPATWERCANALKDIRSLADGRSVPLVAVIFPLFDYSFDQTYPFLDLHHKVQQHLSALAVPTLDLFEAYRGKDNYRLTVIPGADSHPNEIANRIAAEEIYKFLFSNGLVPKELEAEFVRARNVYDPLRIRRLQPGDAKPSTAAAPNANTEPPAAVP